MHQIWHVIPVNKSLKSVSCQIRLHFEFYIFSNIVVTFQVTCEMDMFQNQFPTI